MAEVKESTKRVIWGMSGSLCAMCQQYLIHENETGAFPLGQIAHIEGDKPDAKRYRADQPDSERHGSKNLMLLCGTCHTKIDRDDSTYTVEKLLDMKHKHEKNVQDSLQALVIQVGFAELEVTLSYLISVDSSNNAGTLQVIPPKDKIRKNNLSTEVENLLRMGLMQQKEIDDYLNKNPDMNLAKKLRSAFIDKYEEFKKTEPDSNALFYELLSFASNNSPEFKYRAAGLTVVSYYFNLCDVFEK